MSSTRVLLVVKNPKKVHNYVRQVLENGNRVRYLTTASRTDLIAKMSARWSGVGKYVQSGRLSVQSAYNHFPEDEGPDVAGKKSHKSVKNTIVIICPTAVTEYFKTRVPKSVTTESKVNSIMKLEASVGDQFSNSVVVCCVFDRLVQSLDLVSLLILMKYHALAIRHDDKIIPLSDPDVLDMIRKGMDVLGGGSSTLILKTLQHVYNIDERAILQEPFVWCSVLKKICGEYSANLILNAIIEEMRRMVMQGNPPDGNQERRQNRDHD